MSSNAVAARFRIDMDKEIFDKIISVASGEKSKSEINDYGDDEFNPWIIGATL